MRILVLNGPNLDLLGEREPGVYGTATLSDIEDLVRRRARQLDVQVDFFQSNHEGVLIDTLHEARLSYDGVVYNAGAHTHYSYAIRDAIAAIRIPVVEVHISDVDSREEFRHISVIAPVCVTTIKGHGIAGYVEGLEYLVEHQGR